jgi:hypothetical protein
VGGGGEGEGVEYSSLTTLFSFLPAPMMAVQSKQETNKQKEMMIEVRVAETAMESELSGEVEPREEGKGE